MRGCCVFTACDCIRAWVGDLRPEDDRNLKVVGLPGYDAIKRIARNPKIHGFIYEGASPGDLRRLLADPAVRSVNVADAAFDLTPDVIETSNGERVRAR